MKIEIDRNRFIVDEAIKKQVAFHTKIIKSTINQSKTLSIGLKIEKLL
jgi:hypothetical protein